MDVGFRRLKRVNGRSDEHPQYLPEQYLTSHATTTIWRFFGSPTPEFARAGQQHASSLQQPSHRLGRAAAAMAMTKGGMNCPEREGLSAISCPETTDRNPC